MIKEQHRAKLHGDVDFILNSGSERAIHALRSSVEFCIIYAAMSAPRRDPRRTLTLIKKGSSDLISTCVGDGA